MGVVEDVRKLLQDLVTPEMRALAEQVKNLNEKVDNLDKNLNHRMDVQDKNINQKIDSLHAEMNRRFDYMETTFRLDERVSLLEAERRKEKPSSH